MRAIHRKGMTSSRFLLLMICDADRHTVEDLPEGKHHIRESLTFHPDGTITWTDTDIPFDLND